MSVEAATKPLSGISKVFKSISGALAGALGPLGMLLQIFEALGIIQPILDLVSAFVSILASAFIPILIMLINVITPLIPPFQLLVTAITPLITQVFTLFTGLGFVQSILPIVITAITWLAGVLNILMPVVQTVVGAIGNLIGPIGLLQIAFTVMGVAIGTIIGIITGIVDIFKNGGGLADIGKLILDHVIAGFVAVTDWFGGIWDRIIDAIQASWDANKEKITEFFT